MSLQELFTVVLNMSITASYVAVGVMFVRLLFKKAPRIFSYLLWSIVLFRLLCPFSIQTDLSVLNILNVDANDRYAPLEYVPLEIGAMDSPTVQTGINSLDSAISPSLPQATPMDSANPMQIRMAIFSVIWIAGMVVLLFCSAISYVRLKRNLRFATLMKDNIYESDQISTAFVCGLIHPIIYIPVQLKESDLVYILSHEKTHIQRKDHIVKFVSFLALIIHWFNPIMWLSFNRMSKDMEMSCDEAVLRNMNKDAKIGYSNSLLSLSLNNRSSFSPGALAFGESHIKSRIKNIVNFKKPVFWVIIFSTVLLIITGISFISNPVSGNPDLSFLNPNSMLSIIAEQDQILIESVEYGKTFVDGTELTKWLDIAENRWRRKIIAVKDMTPSIIIYVNEATGNEIRFFESRNMVMTVYQDQSRYYRIPEQDYQAIRKMALSGVPHVDRITFTQHVNGKDTTSFITDNRQIIEKTAVLVHRGKKTRPYLLHDSTLNDEPPVADYLRIEMTGENVNLVYFLYSEGNNNYYIDKPYDSIHKADDDMVRTIKSFLTASGFDTEKSLDVILSSPTNSLDANEHINAHKDEYENIMKYGGENALQYMLSQFESGNAEGLRGAVMMILCKELLGPRSNVKDQSLSPQEWYKALDILSITDLPHYEYDGDDPLEKLVYTTEIQQRADSNRKGFIIVAPKIFGSYEEDDFLKVFVTTYFIRYELYKDTLSETEGSIIPAAITYQKNKDGEYILKEYEQAGDGSQFSTSIKRFCTMPKSNKTIKGLADRILRDYGDHDELHKLLYENLFKHLVRYGVKKATLMDPRGNMIFSMNEVEYRVY